MKNRSSSTKNIKGSRADEYLYNVAWSEEDELFVGRVVEFPSLAAHGDTLEKALREIKKVVDFVIADMAVSGETMIEPLSRRHYSGRLNLRMPPQLHRQLSAEAERQKVSLNQWITMKLSSNATV
jgi:predicted HicB family RNase H-like nuclease